MLLQASTKDRRTIFEEAAGISRFKAKKTETLRRLERVDQNLQRLRDIVDEVEKQLRSVQLQAAKAQRSQEYTARLKELRSGPGPARVPPVHANTGREDGRVRGAARRPCARRRNRPTPGSASCGRLEESLARLDVAAREQEAHLSAARQAIAAEETTLAHGWAQADDLEGRTVADATAAWRS